MGDERVVLVTGAAGGIGSAVLRRFAAGGWRCASADLVAPTDTVAHHVPTDVRSVAACRTAVQTTVDALGRLDVLVNAAGGWHGGDTAGTREEDFHPRIDVNLKGT